MAPSSEPTLNQTLNRLETQVWDALCTGDAAGDERLLDRTFLGVYSDGFAGRAAHVAQLRDGPSVASYALMDVQYRELGPDLGLISYLAEYQPVGGTDRLMYVSSIWQRGSDGWRNIFSQDTPAK